MTRNPPAFPNEQHETADGTWNQTFDSGMSLRDWFAGQALHRALSATYYDRSDDSTRLVEGEEHEKAAAQAAYRIADAMLAEREKSA